MSTIIDLGAAVAPTAVNASGQVVGDVASNGATHAFLYSQGTFTDLGTVAGFADSYANALNDNGKVVGYLDNGYGSEEHAMLYNGRTMTDRGTAPGYTDGVATGITDFGQAIGNAGTSMFDLTDGFFYDASHGTFTSLGTLPGYVFAEASALNASGQVVGFAHNPARVNQAFLWQDGVMTGLGFLSGFANSYANAINASGQVAGNVQGFTPSQQHAFLWTPDMPNGTTGTMIDLGTLAGDSSSSGSGIDTAGEVVGTSTSSTTVERAFLYRNGTMTDLNTLLPSGSGWSLQTAVAINDAGQIVGTGLLNGTSHGFLLDLNAGPATRSADVVVADAPALAQVTAAPQGGGSSLQPPLAPADTARPDQLTAAPVTAAPGSTSVPPATESAPGLPASPGLTPTPLDLLNAADLLGPEATVPTSPPG